MTMTANPRLVIATHNPNKVREIAQMLPGWEVVAEDSGAEETAETFAGNALIKARALTPRHRGAWILADDSGLEVAALGGAPGVRSARYAGRDGDTPANNALLLRNLAGVTDRRARFTCAIALIDPDGREHSAEGHCSGRIIDAPSGAGGFGYDPLFVPDGFDRTFAELEPEAKNMISHRGRALAAARKILESGGRDEARLSRCGRDEARPSRADARRNLAVGHFFNEPFIDACAPHLARIREVFFAWPGVLSCRPAPDYTDELKERLYSDLAWCRRNGILLDTLFNSNCYGDSAISAELAAFVEKTLWDMEAHSLFPDIVTTTSPFIATVLRRRFPGVEIRWSVNLRVHGTTGFECVDELFDSFYVTRERQRDAAYLAEVARWAKDHGKIVGMQANSGCLRQCPFQTFHDNLHGHGDGRRRADQDAAREFDFSFFRCRTHFAHRAWEDFIRATWIRPEDIPLFEPHVDVVKLATRRHRFPKKVLDAYAAYSYDGNLLDLMDPVHSDLFAPNVIDNKSFPADFATTVGACPHANDCRHCGKCAKVLEKVLAVNQD